MRRYALAFVLLLVPTLVASQIQHGETTGSVCFARGSAVLTEEAKSALSHIIGIQTMDLRSLAVEAFGDPGNAAIARARAESIRNFLSDALEIDASKIRVQATPNAAWPGRWRQEVFTGGMAELPCTGPEAPAPAVIQLSGICKPRNCFRMVCGAASCWGRKD